MGTAYTAIDGDLADFIEAQREASMAFMLSELEQYLLNEGHAEEVVYAALSRWEPDWFAVEGETFRLTADGERAVDELKSRAR